MNKKHSAYIIYLVFSAVTALLFSMVFTVNIIYQVEKVNLTPFQLILIGTALEISCFLFEIPTGIVADIYSRKLSVIIGTVLIGLGFILEGSIPMFIFLILAQVLWGIGHTFISGAIDAWIAEEDKTKKLNIIYMKGSQISEIASIIGIILSTIIGNFSIRLPIIIGGALFIVLALFLFLYMPEENFKSSAPKDLNTFKKMGHTFANSLKYIKNNTILISILSVSLFYGLSSEGYDRLSTAHFLKDTTLPKLGNLQPVTWFGIFSIIGTLLSISVIQVAIKKSEKLNKLKNAVVLLAINSFYILCMLIFALTKDFNLMLIAYLTTNMFRTINEPIFNSWLNNHIDDNSRATVLSVNGQINSLGQIIGGPIIGIIASKISISIGIACTALMLTPIIIIYLLTLQHDNKVNR